jgi:hypothetical protein
MSDSSKTSGYNAADDHFHQADRVALEALRAKRDAQREEQKQEADKNAHWMKCPKCGDDLVEVKLDVVMVDRCNGCQGIFFDSGEVELLLEAHEKDAGFFGKMFGR